MSPIGRGHPVKKITIDNLLFMPHWCDHISGIFFWRQTRTKSGPTFPIGHTL